MVVMAYGDWRYSHKLKITYPDAASAQPHADQLNERGPLPRHEGRRFHAYACTWTDDYREGQVGRVHFHVGREPRPVEGAEGGTS